MRQVKRFIYFVMLNVIVSAVTVVAVLQWWESKHPSTPIESTSVIIVVTAAPPGSQQVMLNDAGTYEIAATDTGILETGMIKATPTFGLLSYQVKEGDILGALAVQFNVSVADIMSVNGISNPDSLYVGQIILIPSAPLPTATLTPPPPTPISSPTPKPPSTATLTPSATPTSTPISQEPQVKVDKVIGVGDLETERVELLRSGDGELSLAGWRIEDGEGNVYTFPELTLYKGGAIHINTRRGQDTVTDLFWGLTHPIWERGKIVYLYNAKNELQSSYTIP